MKSAFLFLLFFASIQGSWKEVSEAPIHYAYSEDIVIRHDKPDSLYRALGAKFPAVCKVGERGGDGTLIAPQWVITAAHVAEGMFMRKGADLKIYFENSDQAFEVDGVYLHPDFVPMQGADIALIKLKNAVKGIKPVKLYTQSKEAGKEIILVGHGDFKTGQGGEWTIDGIKRGATNLVDKVSQTTIEFDFDAPPEGTNLEGTAGRGDSGGPALLIEQDIPFIIGISSAGFPGKNGPGTYGAIEHYTRVSAFNPWIKETISGKGKTKPLSMEATSVQPRMGEGGNTKVRMGGGDKPLEGLGLFLRQNGDRIQIGGKADPLVPEGFRNVSFKPPSFLVAFNGEEYTSLEAFKASYGVLKSGDAFTITFEIQGEVKEYRGEKM